MMHSVSRQDLSFRKRRIDAPKLLREVLDRAMDHRCRFGLAFAEDGASFLRLISELGLSPKGSSPLSRSAARISSRIFEKAPLFALSPADLPRPQLEAIAVHEDARQLPSTVRGEGGVLFGTLGYSVFAMPILAWVVIVCRAVMPSRVAKRRCRHGFPM